MAARRGKTPPYEIMRSVSRPLGGSGAPSPSATSESAQASASALQGGHAGAQAGDEPGGGAWWSRSWNRSGVGVPIILRVPRGVAVLIALGLIGLLVLAYWAGHSRGDAAGAERMRAELQESPAAIEGRQAPGAPPTTGHASQAGQTGSAFQPDTQYAGQTTGSRDTGGTTTATRDTTGQAAQAAQAAQAGQAGGTARVHRAGTAGDPREPGLNYMILARYPPDEAERLAQFLAGFGVETVLDVEDNQRFVRVWAVDHGFSREQLGGETHNAYRTRLRDAGRAWQRHNRGRGDALETMYLHRYRGE